MTDYGVLATVLVIVAILAVLARDIANPAPQSAGAPSERQSSAAP